MWDLDRYGLRPRPGGRDQTRLDVGACFQPKPFARPRWSRVARSNARGRLILETLGELPAGARGAPAHQRPDRSLLSSCPGSSLTPDPHGGPGRPLTFPSDLAGSHCFIKPARSPTSPPSAPFLASPPVGT